jgi:long-chain acyl-CoA synthetase
MPVDPHCDTFPKLLARNAQAKPWKTALREKELGIWQSCTWQQYLDRVRACALAFRRFGIERNDKVAIIGDNRPQWMIAEVAAQACGAIPVGLYQDSVPSEVAYVIDHSDARIVVAENQEQVDKILELLDRLPKVQLILYGDGRGMRNYVEPRLRSFDSIIAQGRELHSADPSSWERMIEGGRADDVAILCYTSGTTGRPKGAMLTFRNMLSMVESLHQVDPRLPQDEFVSFLPLPWVGEQMIAVGYWLWQGFTVNFPEEPETVSEDLREIAPHTMVAPPRIWENMASLVQVKIMDSSSLKRWLYGLCMPIGMRVADCRFERKSAPLHVRLARWCAEWLLFRALKDHLGLSNIRTCATGGGALGPDVFRFFHAMGVPLKQLYGQTEIVGISCIHRDRDIQAHTVGQPIPGTELTISTSGEILSRSAALFQGYYKDEEGTRATLEGGWLHSGDAGYLTPDGHLVVIDRVKDVMKLADGTTFSPQFVENRLKFSPYIKEAVVFGKNLPYLATMICIDMGVVGTWAERNGIAYTTYTDLSSKGPVYDLVLDEIRKVNETLPEAARIRKFALLYKELDADDEELTRTRKLRRGFVAERYKDVVEALYAGRAEVDIDTTIRFQDGRSSRLQTVLQIRALTQAV